MINRIDINKYSFSYEGESYEALAPFSLSSIIAKSDAPNRISGDEELSFTSSFVVTEELLNQRFAYLLVDGQHGGERIFINDKELEFEDSLKLKKWISVNEYLHIGDNSIKVMPQIPTTQDLCFDRIGVSFSCFAVFFDVALIEGVFTDYTVIDGTLTVNLNLSVLGSVENCNTVATLVSSAGQYYYGTLSDGKGQIVITDPLLWYSSDIGVPNLYKLTLTLYYNGEVEDVFETNTGYRSVIASEKVPVINGKEFVIRGAVYKETDGFNPDRRLDQLKSLVESAAYADVNTFIVKGAELPSDAFYTFCDEQGIAVIVEGCLDERMIATHPSIIAVYGGLGMSFSSTGFEISAPWDLDVINVSASLCSFSEIAKLVSSDDLSIFSLPFEDGGENFDRNISLVSSVASEYRFVSNVSLLSYLSGVSVGDGILRHTALRDRETSPNLAVSAFNSDSALISDGVVDHRGMPKAALFFLKKAYSAAQLYSSYDGERALITVRNNSKNELGATLKWMLIDSEAVLLSGTCEITVSSAYTLELPSDEILSVINGKENKVALLCELTTASGVVARSSMLFTKAKYFHFENPDIKTSVAGNGKSFTVTVTASRYAYRVQLTSEHFEGVFSDNYFDLIPSVPYRVSFTAANETTPELISDSLRVISMYDVHRF